MATDPPFLKDKGASMATAGPSPLPAPLRAIRQAIHDLQRDVREFGIDVMVQAALYPIYKAYHEGRFAAELKGKPGRGSWLRGAATVLGIGRQARHSAPRWVAPGRILGYRSSAPGSHPASVELDCERAAIQLAFPDPAVVRVRLRPSSPPGEGRFPPPFSYAVVCGEDTWPPVEIEVQEEDGALAIRTRALHCRVDQASAALSFSDPDGTPVQADAPGVTWDAEAGLVTCAKRLLPGEHLYGLGEKTSRLDKRGLVLDMWNTDPHSYRPGDDPIYANIPVYLGLVEAKPLERAQDGHRAYGYGIWVDHSTRGHFDLGASVPGVTRWSYAMDSSGDILRYYFLYGPALSDVLARSADLTGHATMLPLWALGYHQNRWSYAPAARVREIAREFRQRRIPCEAIHLDIDYMDGFRCFSWHPECFADPAALIADLHADGFKVVTMIDPGIKVDPDYPVCAQGLAEGVFCAYPDGQAFRGPVWPGQCYFPDFTSARVRAWWGRLYQGLVKLGVDGFWNDMNEPSVFSPKEGTFPDSVRHEWEGQWTDHREAHNVYGMQMARATAEGLLDLRPDERPLVISRSVWAGSQRYNTHWLGDNYSEWDALRNVPQLVLNMGLSGIGFTGPDTGGFTGNCTAELLIRWNQLSTFTPFFRNHSAKGTEDQEPWALGELCERISREFIALRYQLLPYLYTALWQSTQTGMPMLRPLCLAFQQDPFAVDGKDGRSPDDAFMCGDALLVVPVTEPGCTSREVYVPPGRWFDFWENTLIAGPQIAQLDAPMERIPVLVRAGSVVPMWPPMQHIGERQAEVLILHAYLGDGESWLYEDDGHTWAFRQGAYQVTRLACTLSPDRSTFTIAHTTHGAYASPCTRIEVHVHGLQDAPSKVEIDGRPLPLPAPFDRAARTLSLDTEPFEQIEIRLAPGALAG
jgi:alpha-glucosidase